MVLAESSSGGVQALRIVQATIGAKTRTPQTHEYKHSIRRVGEQRQRTNILCSRSVALLLFLRQDFRCRSAPRPLYSALA
jgi:hypothetical protein